MIYINWWVYPVASMGLTASSWIMVLLTVYRFLAVSVHGKHKKYIHLKYVRIQVAIIIIVSILIGLPKYFESSPVQLGNDEYTYTTIEPTALWWSQHRLFTRSGLSALK